MLILRVGRLAVRGDSDTQTFRGHGINFEHAESGAEALGLVQLYDYDLALVDLELPDMPGQELVRSMRAAGCTLPSIVIAETASPQLKMRVLDEGADDFVTARCPSDELLARVRAVIRRTKCHRGAPDSFRFGPVELFLDRHEVRIDGEPFPVTRREFSLLQLMCLNPGVVLSKAAFFKHLYNGMEEAEIKTVDVIVCRLRKKLALAGVPDFINTVWGVGYTLREPRIAVEQVPETANPHLMPMAA
jgi:two-component system, cell cycle response regulator CtrA